MESVHSQVGVSIIGALLLLLMIGIGIVGFLFWIWMLIDCAMNEPSEGSDKIVWVLIIILLSWLGALIYFCAKRPKRLASQRGTG